MIEPGDRDQDIPPLDRLERFLSQLTDAELLAHHHVMHADDPTLDIVCGELERRGIDL